MASAVLDYIPEIVDQHAEEAAFLWLLRDAAVRAPHYSLEDLAELDERVEAHLDGLRVAGEPGWQRCLEALDYQEPGEVFAAAVLAFESGEEGRIEQVLEVAASAPELGRAAISALGWMPFEAIVGQVDLLLAAAEPRRRHIGIAACAVHRRNHGYSLERCLADEDRQVRARALRAAGELGRRDLVPRLQPGLESDHQDSRYFAARSLALLGAGASAVPALQATAEAGGSRTEEACTLAVRCLAPRRARVWLQKLLSRPETARLAIVGFGALGQPEAVPLLVKQMAEPALARPAGEAVAMITGLDLEDEPFEAEPPEDFEAGPPESPEDEDVDMDRDEDLPWPDPEAVAAWWSASKGRFAEGVRHLTGRPLERPAPEEILSTGLQRQRAAAAVELALADPHGVLSEVRAPGGRQARLLEAASRAT